VDPLLAVAGPILTLLGVLAAGYFTYRSSSRKLHSDSGQKMIDQMQEDVAEMRREIADAAEAGPHPGRLHRGAAAAHRRRASAAAADLARRADQLGGRAMMGRDCFAHRHSDDVPLELHHVWPKSYQGGPDVKANRIMLWQ
jgi:hypothetical protein